MQVFNPQAVKDYRESKGLTQEEAGKRAGFGGTASGQTWYAYEAGKITRPRTETLERIAKALEVTTDDLMVEDLSQDPVGAQETAAMVEVVAAYEQGFTDGLKAAVKP